MPYRRPKQRLFVAHVTSREVEVPRGTPRAIYAVLALSPGDAVRAIRKELGNHCIVEFKADHGLPEVETIQRFNLEDGRARLISSE